MSRIGNKIIEIPEGVSAKVENGIFIAAHEQNENKVEIHPLSEVKIENNTIKVSRKNETKFAKSVHGLIRSLIANALEGVKNGFSKQLEIVGVGYKAQVEGNLLKLKVGFSHEVEYVAPKGITFEVKKNIISISGIDKQLVGQVAADIRAIKKPEPYKGKGIKYVGEKIIRKVGKAVKGAGGA
jgi:large subunit ribosomal protein L6